MGPSLDAPPRTLSAFQRENDIPSPGAAASGRLGGPRGGVRGTGHGDPPREAGGASHFGPTAGSLAGDPRTRRQPRLRGGTRVAESRKDQIPRRLLSVRKRPAVVAESVWQYVAAIAPEPRRRCKAALLALPSGDTPRLEGDYAGDFPAPRRIAPFHLPGASRSDRGLLRRATKAGLRAAGRPSRAALRRTLTLAPPEGRRSGHGGGSPVSCIGHYGGAPHRLKK